MSKSHEPDEIIDAEIIEETSETQTNSNDLNNSAVTGIALLAAGWLAKKVAASMYTRVAAEEPPEAQDDVATHKKIGGAVSLAATVALAEAGVSRILRRMKSPRE